MLIETYVLYTFVPLTYGVSEIYGSTDIIYIYNISLLRGSENIGSVRDYFNWFLFIILLLMASMVYTNRI